MIEENIDFTKPRLLPFQAYLDHANHIQVMGNNFLVVVDSSNLLYFYNIAQPDEDTLKKGRSYHPNRSNYEPITFLQSYSDSSLILKYEDSDILILPDIFSQK